MNAKEIDGLRSGAGLHHQSRQTVHAADNFRKLAQRGLEFFETPVEGSGGFEIQIRGSGVTLRGDFVQQRVAPRVEVRLHAGNFDAIFVVRAPFETGCQAHFHFGVDAAGERWVGVKVIDTAAHLKEIERVVRVFFSRGARGKRAVVDGFSLYTAKTRRDRGARILVFHMQLDQGSKAQA